MPGSPAALQGAMLFAQNGYTLQIPDIVAELTEEYREREDWLSNFLQECCTLEPDARAPAGELYQMYREWAESSGDYVRRNTEFVAAMEGRGDQDRPGEEIRGVCCIGLRLGCATFLLFNLF